MECLSVSNELMQYVNNCRFSLLLVAETDMQFIVKSNATISKWKGGAL